MQIQQYSAKQLEGMIEQFAFDGFQELNEEKWCHSVEQYINQVFVI